MVVSCRYAWAVELLMYASSYGWVMRSSLYVQFCPSFTTCGVMVLFATIAGLVCWLQVDVHLEAWFMHNGIGLRFMQHSGSR